MSVPVRVQDLEKNFGRYPALKSVSLDVAAGELVALLGPSGSGKTTLLRAVAGLEQADGGHVFFGDIDANGLSLRERRIGFVFQHYALFRHMRVFDNVAFGPRIAGMTDRKKLGEIVESCLKRAALWDEVGDRLKDSALALSGGQQQRLCIARALATDPEVLLMDEPASALDPASTARVEDLIFELRRNYTIVIVTHNMQQAARVSEFTAFFFQGRLIEMDRTDQLFTKPKQKETEDYITGRFG